MVFEIMKRTSAKKEDGQRRGRVGLHRQHPATHLLNVTTSAHFLASNLQINHECVLQKSSPAPHLACTRRLYHNCQSSYASHPQERVAPSSAFLVPWLYGFKNRYAKLQIFGSSCKHSDCTTKACDQVSRSRYYLQ